MNSNDFEKISFAINCILKKINILNLMKKYILLFYYFNFFDIVCRNNIQRIKIEK